MPAPATKIAPQKSVLLSVADLPKPSQRLGITSVTVGSWNGGDGMTVYVRELAASEADVWQRIMRHIGGSPPLDDVLDYLMCAICTPDGGAVFSSSEDREVLKSQSLAVLYAIFTKAMEAATITTATIESEKKG